MKLLKNILAVLLVLMISVITFFSFNLFYAIVGNHASITKVELAPIPMMIFMSEIIIVLFAVFNYIVLKRRDAYFFRKYAYIIGGFSLVGLVFSILSGTYIYHTFFGDYVFLAYPFVMTLTHALFLGASIYIGTVSILYIAKHKPERQWKNTKFYWVRELLIAELLVYSLNRLGAFTLLPMFISDYDSAYVIPFYIQLLMPIFVFVIYMVDKHWKHSAKIIVILSSIVVAYSLCSLTYMLIIAHNTYPLVVNPLSPIMQLERLITKPVGFIIIYLVSILIPGGFIIYNEIRMHKKK